MSNIHLSAISTQKWRGDLGGAEEGHAAAANRPIRPRRAAGNSLEALESRIAPATLTWTGAIDSNWGTAGNWSGGSGSEVPNSADDILIFSAGASNLTNTNNLTSLDVDQIVLSGLGYALGGNAVSLATGLSDSTATGANTVGLALGGGGGVTKSGEATLTFSGTAANTFLGVTTVNAASSCSIRRE